MVGKDVYKRQVLCRMHEGIICLYERNVSSFPKENAPMPFEKWPGEIWAEHAGIVEAISRGDEKAAAVSYTHLDVYKRQAAFSSPFEIASTIPACSAQISLGHFSNGIGAFSLGKDDTLRSYKRIMPSCILHKTSLCDDATTRA